MVARVAALHVKAGLEDHASGWTLSGELGGPCQRPKFNGVVYFACPLCKSVLHDDTADRMMHTTSASVIIKSNLSPRDTVVHVEE